MNIKKSKKDEDVTNIKRKREGCEERKKENVV